MNLMHLHLWSGQIVLTADCTTAGKQEHEFGGFTECMFSHAQSTPEELWYLIPLKGHNCCTTRPR